MQHKSALPTVTEVLTFAETLQFGPSTDVTIVRFLAQPACFTRS